MGSIVLGPMTVLGAPKRATSSRPAGLFAWALLSVLWCNACTSIVLDTGAQPEPVADGFETSTERPAKPAPPSVPDAAAHTAAQSQRDDANDGQAVPTMLLISVDGLASRFLQSEIEAGNARAFARMQREGAFTHNARTEARISVTMPNHISMLTGRPAMQVPGAPADTAHNCTDNYDPGDGYILHSRNPDLGYLPSIFDETHDRGGYTALYSGKSKFLTIRRSYSSPVSRVDLIGEDDGRDKIDDFDIIEDATSLTAQFMSDFTRGVERRPAGPNFALLHFRDTDSVGHAYGWGSAQYLEALRLVDRLLGGLLDAMKVHPELAKAVVILTTDHGGIDTGHFDPGLLEVVQIPFYVWGPGIPGGVDLYELSGGTRTDPGATIPMDESGPRPIRNGDAGNLALDLMGLPQVTGSWHTGLKLQR